MKGSSNTSVQDFSYDQSCGWGLMTTHSCPQFWHSKSNSNSTQFIELFGGVSEQIKPLQSFGQAAEFEPLQTSAGRLAITPEDYSRRQSKDLTAKSMTKRLGPRSGTVGAGRTGENKHTAFPSRRQSLLAATGSLEENVLPLLRYWLSSRVKKVLTLCRYQAATSHFFFHVKWNFRWNRREVVADQSNAHHFAQSCNHSLVSG